jgi:hypothetical protein
LKIEYRFSDKWRTKELKYSLLGDGAITTFGTGVTIDFSSGGVAFTTEHHLKPGAHIEVRIDWPQVSGDTCPMLLVACGRIVRSAADRALELETTQLSQEEFLRLLSVVREIRDPDKVRAKPQAVILCAHPSGFCFLLKSVMAILRPEQTVEVYTG